jgi:DNA-binding NtrC family response regulator
MSLRVLLVDDEAEFLETLCKRLARREVEAFTASSGEAALAFLTADEVDVVVLDVKMPGMDGIETLKRIKELRPEQEVIMLTGHASMEAAIQGMQLGAFDYIMKPTDISQLLYKIEDARKKHGLKAGAGRRDGGGGR